MNLRNFKITNRGLYWGLIATFSLLYLLVAFVSTLHAIDFFRLANIGSLAILLGIAYEVGQASVLFSILMTKNRDKFLPWALMFLLTSLQVTANVYASFKHMVLSGTNDWVYWQKSILIGVQAENAEMYQVIISWISGALLPIVALGMTALVAQNIKLVTKGEEDSTDSDELKEEQQPVDASYIVSEVSKIRPTEEELDKIETILKNKKPIEKPPVEEIVDVEKKETEVKIPTENINEPEEFFEPDDDEIEVPDPLKEDPDYIESDVKNKLLDIQLMHNNGLIEDLIIDSPENEVLDETPPLIEPEKRIQETPSIEKNDTNPEIDEIEKQEQARLEKIRQIARENLIKKK